ncbi:snake venom metalloproteinase fibrolase-like [Huso huso]|uniref:Snake venom metalloproteinase fibrolase-like n=1 Tax=Huso huso TaxID=61971 RepID=A0ABR1A982_HUSHU
MMDLLTEPYTEHRYSPDSSLLSEQRHPLNHCCYTGWVEGLRDSRVALCTCQGLSGYLTLGPDTYTVSPETEGSSRHRVSRSSQRRRRRGAVGLGTQDTSPTGDPAAAPVKQYKYNIELFLVADTAEFRRQGRDVERTRRSLISIAHHLRQIYSQLDMGVFLVGIEIWTEQDKAQVTHSSIETLTNFLKWKETELVPRAPHDNVQLVSGVHFEENVLGEATISTMCSLSTSGGVIQNPGVSTVALSNYMAHEIGHNLGMYHDTQDCHCAAHFGKCLLAGNTWVFPTLSPLFSDCSKTFLKNFLAKASASCLLDRPRSFIVTADLTKPNRPPLILAAVVSLFIVAVLVLVTMTMWKRLKAPKMPQPSPPLLGPNLEQPEQEKRAFHLLQCIKRMCLKTCPP